MYVIYVCYLDQTRRNWFCRKRSGLEDTRGKSGYGGRGSLKEVPQRDVNMAVGHCISRSEPQGRTLRFDVGVSSDTTLFRKVKLSSDIRRNRPMGVKALDCMGSVSCGRLCIGRMEEKWMLLQAMSPFFVPTCRDGMKNNASKAA